MPQILVENVEMLSFTRRELMNDRMGTSVVQVLFCQVTEQMVAFSVSVPVLWILKADVEVSFAPGPPPPDCPNFLDTKKLEWSLSQSTQQHARTDTGRSCPSKSAKDGGSPPVQHQVAHLFEGSTREEAKAREHAVDSIRVQRRSHTSAVENQMWEGTSRALAKANRRTKSAASLLHRPPVSIAM